MLNLPTWSISSFRKNSLLISESSRILYAHQNFNDLLRSLHPLDHMCIPPEPHILAMKIIEHPHHQSKHHQSLGPVISLFDPSKLHKSLPQWKDPVPTHIQPDPFRLRYGLGYWYEVTVSVMGWDKVRSQAGQRRWESSRIWILPAKVKNRLMILINSVNLGF